MSAGGGVLGAVHLQLFRNKLATWSDNATLPEELSALVEAADNALAHLIAQLA